MAVPAVSTGLSITPALRDFTQGGRSRPEDDPLSYLTPSDWQLVSHAVGFSVNPNGKLFPLLAFQIGWDRQSGALTGNTPVTTGYLRSMASSYRDRDPEATLGIGEQIAAAIAYLQRFEQPAPRLDVRA